MGLALSFDSFSGGRTAGAMYDEPRCDLRYDLTISLEDVIKGTSREIQVPRIEPCNICRGTGARKGTRTRTCPSCKGSGQIQQIQQSGFARLVRVQPCNDCRGRGTIVDSPCEECGGEGRAERTRKIRVNIPAGIESGERLRLAGEGDARKKAAPPGDLYISVNVRPHEIFERDGPDIYCTIPIGFAEAALGAKLKYQRLKALQCWTYQVDSNRNNVFRMRGKERPFLIMVDRGDEFVRIIC